MRKVIVGVACLIGSAILLVPLIDSGNSAISGLALGAATILFLAALVFDHIEVKHMNKLTAKIVVAQLHPMTLDGYQKAAGETAVYPDRMGPIGLMYSALGTAGEAGEVADKVKKLWRDHGKERDWRHPLVSR
jgi:hypothetical protein